MPSLESFMACSRVAPLAGAWIEIPSCGWEHLLRGVAPLAGAWIEIALFADTSDVIIVAPLAGAWIEISPSTRQFPEATSLPSRERGLKYG